MGKKVDIARVQGSDEQRRRIWAAAGRAGRRVGPWLLSLGLDAAAAQERAETEARRLSEAPATE